MGGASDIAASGIPPNHALWYHTVPRPTKEKPEAGRLLRCSDDKRPLTRGHTPVARRAPVARFMSAVRLTPAVRHLPAVRITLLLDFIQGIWRWPFLMQGFV